MTKNIELLGHASIKIDKIYFDPFQLTENYNDAEYIFITHSHYDHFSEEDILKVKSENSVIIITNDLYEKTLLLGFASDKIIVVEPNKTYNINGLEFATIPAYNINKPFHPKENNWVGYILELEDKKIYIAGDTDVTEESKNVICDIALVPVGGTYTMTCYEAAELVNIIKPKKVIPIHYAEIVGEKQDAIKFKGNVNNNIKVEIQI